MNSLYYSLVKALIAYRKTVVFAMAAITLFFLSQIFRVEMFTEFLDLFPQDHAYVKVHNTYAKYFGGAYQATLMLKVKNGDVFNKETLEKMRRIQYAVDLIPGVDHFAIFSIASPKVSVTKEEVFGFSTRQIMKEVPATEEALTELKKKVLTSSVSGTLVSRDRKALLLNANFIEGRIDFSELFDKFMELKKKEEDANHSIYLTGTPILYGWIYHYLPEMGVIFGATAIVILLMLFAYMSQGGLWFWPFASAALTSIWGMGLASLLGLRFDPLIIVIPFLLSARALSHGVQWVERFNEEYQKSGDVIESAQITGAGLFPPGIIAIASDALALLVIYLTPIPILRNLAYLGFYWSAAMVFTIFILYPALFSMFKQVKVLRRSDVPATRTYRIEYFTEHLLRRILVKMSNWTFGKGRYITVGISLIILIVAVVSSSRLKYGDANPGSPILWPDSEFNTDAEEINLEFPGVDQMWIVISGKEANAVYQPDVVSGMEALKYHMMEDPNVGFAVSIADLVKGISSLTQGNDPKMALIPQGQVDIMSFLNVYSMGTSPGEMDPWVTPAFDASNVRLYLKNHEGSVLEEVIGRVTNFIHDNPGLMKNAVAEPAGGIGGILAAANQTIKIKNDQILIIILAIIFVLCAVTYRSFLAGFIFVMSLILANFLAFTYMVFKGIGLNINTFPVVSLGIGLGVDYGLYIVSRIIEVQREVKDLQKAVRSGIVTAGRAVFFTATIMSAGVIFWYFSPLRFQAEMGILLGILMMVNMIVGVVVLPAVINIIKPKFITGG